MKIVRLTAENIKKLQAVEIVPNGAIVQITGPNGSGKTSVLDSIYYALAGGKNIASQPVRQGEEKASIKLDLGEIVVTRRFTAGGGTTLTVDAANGASFKSPQKMLDELLGSLTFDPLHFSRMDPKQQLDQLRRLVKLDVDIDELDRLNATDYATRTDVNRDAKALETRVAAFAIANDLPAEAVDVSALLEKIESAGKHNADIETRQQRRQQVRAQIATNDELAEKAVAEATKLRAQADELTQQAAALAEENIKLQEKLASAAELPQPVDISSVRTEIEAAQLVNEQIQLRKQRDELAIERDAKRLESQTLTERMDRRTAERSAAIAAAAMPVPGLSFGDGMVLYNGLPFEQASGAEQLRVSVAIAMATNPKLRVLRIKDGSLLDENGLQLISEMAEDGDYQIWIEQVDTSGKVGIVMEDGHIKTAAEAAA